MTEMAPRKAGKGSMFEGGLRVPLIVRYPRLHQGVRRTEAEKSEISPLTFASSKQPPCIMIFGTADDLLEGAELNQKDSQKAGNSCKILTYKGQGLGFFNYGARGGKHYDLTLAEMDRFLVDLGWLKQK